jgi:ABC-type oligopeptide transport system substrate-binding subunit
MLKPLVVLSAMSAASQGSAQDSKVIRVNVDSLPLSLEPAKVTDIIANWLLHVMGRRLIETNESGVLKGDLAQKWEVLENGRVFRFTIQTGTKFTDGQPLDSFSVKASFQKAITHKANFSFYLERVLKIETPSEDSLVITLDKPMPSFLQVLGEPMFTVSKECGDQVCFSGGYEILKREKGVLLIKRLSDGQIFQFEPLPFESAKKKFENGELEILRSYGAGNTSDVSEMKVKNKITFNDAKSYFIALNSASPKLNSVEKRQAVSEALDLKSADVWLKERKMSVSKSFLSLSMLPKPIEFAKTKEEQPKKKPDQKLKVLVLKSHGIEELARTTFSGVPIELFSVDKAEFVSAFNTGEYDAIVIGYSVTLRGIDYLSIFFHSKSFHNLARLSSPQIDEVVRNGWLAKTNDERKEAFESLLRINHREKFYIPLAHVPLVFALSDKLTTSLENDMSTTILNLDRVSFPK